MRLLTCAVILSFATVALAACGAKSEDMNEAGAASSIQFQTITPEQKDSLIAFLNEMDASIISGDSERIKEAIAPKPYQRALGKAMGMKGARMDAFLVSMDTTLDQTLAMSTFSSHEINYTAIEYVKGKGDVPVAVIPFNMEMVVNGQGFTSEGNYYSVRRDGEWLTLSPSDQQTKKLLMKAFPELSTVPLVVSKIQPIMGG